MKIRRNRNEKSKDKESTLTGLGSTIGGLGGAYYLSKSSKKNSSRIRTRFKEENTRLIKNLAKDEAKPQGTGVYIVRTRKDNKNYNNGAYFLGASKSNKGGDFIISSPDASTLAHELGHSKYEKKGRIKKGVVGNIGRFTHKNDYIGRLFLGVPGARNSFIAGAGIGMLNEFRRKRKEKKTGEKEKESRFLRHSSWGLPLAAAALPITSELLATKKSLGLLRKHGASKKFIREANRGLNKSLGTYAGSAIASAGAGELGRVVGKRIEED